MKDAKERVNTFPTLSLSSPVNYVGWNYLSSKKKKKKLALVDRIGEKRVDFYKYVISYVYNAVSSEFKIRNVFKPQPPKVYEKKFTKIANRL